MLGIPTDMFGNARKPKIIWKSDSNTLYVVATRLQHMWVEGYLAAADKPQPQIAIEVKFIESSRDPSSELGLDWSSTLGDSGNMRTLNNLTYDDKGVPTITTTSTPQTAGGFRADLAPFNSIGNIAKGLESFANPWNSVLSAQDINVKLRAFLKDDTTKTTSYPRMVTTNNREVVIRSVVNQPVLGGSSSSSVGSGSTTSSAISYLPIGTVINILPKKMQNEKVNLNMSITVSSIIGTTVIQGNPYPIASSRVYSAPVEVDSGYTVAVGGLDEAKEQESDSGVPVLNKIPLLGYLFKSHTKSKNHKNLMLFITPKLIDSKDGGLPAMPEAVIPQKPGKLLPQRPRLAAGGGIEGGIEALPSGIAFMKRSADEIGQIIEENRGTKAEFQKLNDLQAAVVRLEKEVDNYTTNHPERFEELSRDKNELSEVKSTISKHRRLLVSKGYY
jgi:type II secretory pathway component GspD/PulD (secretin)